MKLLLFNIISECHTDLRKLLSHVWLFATPWTLRVHGILQARILKWGAFPFSRWSSQLRDQTQVSLIAGRFFTSWATRDAELHQHNLRFRVFFAEFSWNDFLFSFLFWNRQGSRLWVWPGSSQSSLMKVILLKRGEAQPSFNSLCSNTLAALSWRSPAAIVKGFSCPVFSWG